MHQDDIDITLTEQAQCLAGTYRNHLDLVGPVFFKGGQQNIQQA